jgi:nitrite reductase/ring-hydroxylating ferredoxin subunit
VSEPSEMTPVQLEGQVFQVPALCPHRGGWMKYGIVNERAMRITCPLHGATFDLKTGRRICGAPCSDIPVQCENNHVE